jgi:hypothetical protein
VLVTDVLQVFIGGGVFMTALPLAFAAFAANASQDPAAGAAVALKGPSSSIDSVTDSTRRPFRAVLMLLLLCVSQRSAFTLQLHTHTPTWCSRKWMAALTYRLGEQVGCVRAGVLRPLAGLELLFPLVQPGQERVFDPAGNRVRRAQVRVQGKRARCVSFFLALGLL